MQGQQGLILIPARYASTRFPGKPLALLAGKSIIERVYDNCQSTDLHACVVTDDERIENHVKSFGGNVCRVDDDVPSGTERIQLAYERYFSSQNFDFIINVQGDEPLLKSETIKKLVCFHHENSNFDVATLIRKIPELKGGFFDSNKVKAIFSESTHRCHYFSRSAIPFVREDESKDKSKDNEKIRLDAHWYLHIGVYSYRREALQKFCLSPLGYYENLEKLEQLRGLDIGLSYGAITINDFLAGVDTPEDLNKLEGVFSGKIE